MLPEVFRRTEATSKLGVCAASGTTEGANEPLTEDRRRHRQDRSSAQALRLTLPSGATTPMPSILTRSGLDAPSPVTLSSEIRDNGSRQAAIPENFRVQQLVTTIIGEASAGSTDTDARKR